MFTYPPIREQALIRIIESIGQFHCLGSVITYEPTFVVNRLYEILKWNRPWLMVIRERAPIQKKKPKQQEEALEYQKPDDQNGIEESTRLEAVFAYQETEEESNRWNDEWLVRFDQAGGFDFLKE
ncbi:hypothetical protein PENANT_c003G11276 [Penicillium antarcticum]|uniref:Uncharacterized protein n=2 Tax=Penicillium antarcticum TaxID=416450 RepID=A0A1V6QHS7_9EURO|nr:hypothetical protein PENANT_c003G11276 [Penicillium antarcticum]